MGRIPALLLILGAAYVLSAPTPNATEKAGTTTFSGITFRSEPTGRGTFGIIFSCTITFFFCIWTSIHPDILANATSQSRIFYKVTFMVISLIIPESVVIMSFSQWREARAVLKAWRESEHIPNHKKGTLGMEGAYFVVMGGFVIDKPTRGHPDWEKGATEDRSEGYTTLTPRGFRAYLRDGRIHDETFDPREITDKSKANYLGKALAGTQALWLAVQCISRKAAGLPLTLLETHVVIQVVCTAVIYICWWSKPLNVEEPIGIQIRKKLARREPTREGKVGGEKAWGLGIHPVGEVEGDRVGKVPRPMKDEGLAQGEQVKKSWTDARNAVYTTRNPPDNLIAVASTALFHIAQYITNDTTTDEARRLSGSTEDITRSGTTPGALTKGGEWSGHEEQGGTNMDITRADTKGASVGERRRHQAYGMFMEGIMVITIGGLHAAVWSMEFPSQTEQRLWLASSIGMCFFPLAIVTISAFTGYQNDLVEDIWMHQEFLSHGKPLYKGLWGLALRGPGFLHGMCRKRRKNRAGKDSVLLHMMHGFLVSVCATCIVLYAVCIMFITVESYISIRRPPEAVFDTPRWTDFWPHL